MRASLEAEYMFRALVWAVLDTWDLGFFLDEDAGDEERRVTGVAVFVVSSRLCRSSSAPI